MSDEDEQETRSYLLFSDDRTSMHVVKIKGAPETLDDFEKLFAGIDEIEAAKVALVHLPEFALSSEWGES